MKYIALLRQEGQNAPTDIVHKNTITSNKAFTRYSIGSYSLTFFGINTSIDKVVVEMPTHEFQNQFGYSHSVAIEDGNLIISFNSYDLGSNGGIQPYSSIDGAFLPSVGISLKVTIYP